MKMISLIINIFDVMREKEREKDKIIFIQKNELSFKIMIHFKIHKNFEYLKFIPF